MTVIDLADIAKRYGSTQALSGVSVTVQSGEIHALLGENGAGKSTLLKILSGLVQMDSGEILIDDEPVRIHSPADAFHFGIATVHQHFTLVPNLTVEENLRLAVSAWRVINRSELFDSLAEMGLTLSLDVRVDSLGVGQRQLVEIAKALLHKPQVILLDEPTSILAGEEIDSLLNLLRSIANRGTAVVLVSHKLNEALAISDRITVLRSGVKTGELAPTDNGDRQAPELMRQLVAMMFGERPPESIRADEINELQIDPAVVARVRGVTARNDSGITVVSDLSLELRQGEILGIAGIEGNGQQELAEILAGERRIERGTIQLGEIDLTNTGVDAAIRAGVAATTSDRIGIGCVPGASLELNLILKHLDSDRFSRGLRFNGDAARLFATELIDEYDIRPNDPGLPIDRLSGGNIQRVLMARELAFAPRVLICNQPTAGLDLITAKSMHLRLRAAAVSGTAVVLISSDLDELLDHSDRIVVMYRGSIAGEQVRPSFDATRIGRLMVTGQDSAE